MAHIRGSSDRRVLSIREFLGLNENPDGDTQLKLGELSELENFKITPDKHLQIRPGRKTVLDLFPVYEKYGDKFVPWPKLSGVYHGMIQGREHLVVDYGSNLWDVDITGKKEPRNLGICDLDRNQEPICLFGFNNKLYLLDGRSYKCWDGGNSTQFQDVEGYIPTILTSTDPKTGKGVPLENRNRLTGKVKVKFSPDGKTTEFHLPDKKLTNFIHVEGTDAGPTFYPEIGQVWFTKPPAAGTNTVTISYETKTNQRKEVTKMHFAEFFNGATDSRVFLYGDGTNRCIYSSSELDSGKATADYFPDLFEARVGDENSPITGMIRHYSRLIAFKPDSTWVINTNVVSLPTGGVTSVFYVVPANRSIGNEAPGQTVLLENNPISICGGSIYQWKAGSLGENDNRTADRISDRVTKTAKALDPTSLRVYNNFRSSELWILHDGEALILNYAVDAWYKYTNFDAFSICTIGGDLYAFRKDGKIDRISRDYRNDNGVPIQARASTGSMDFGRDWARKNNAEVFLALLPEVTAGVTVSVATDRGAAYPEQSVRTGHTTFEHLSFEHLSFNTSSRPEITRLVMRVRDAAFYRLTFSSDSAAATATILQADIHVRHMGRVK